MCGRYVSPDEAAIERFWRIDRRNNRNPFRRRFNVAPTTLVPILILGPNREHILAEARWGLIPNWWKKPNPPSLTFNARSEEAATKPTWRHSLKHKRCLMPVEGWYEWKEGEQVRNAAGRLVHQPYFVHCPNDPVIAFAGVWAEWLTPEGQSIVSCALLSRDAAPSIHAIHDRMPVVIRPESFEAWLTSETPTADVAAIIHDARTDLAGYRVCPKVNSARNDSPDLVLPLESPK